MPFLKIIFLLLNFSARRKDKTSGGNQELNFSTLLEAFFLRLALKMGRKILEKDMISTPGYNIIILEDIAILYIIIFN